MAAELYEVREYEKVEPCKRTYERPHPACRSEVFYLDVYRAKPVSDMKRSGMELRHGSEWREAIFYFTLTLICNMHRLISAAAATSPFSSRKTAPISSGDFRIPEGRK